VSDEKNCLCCFLTSVIDMTAATAAAAEAEASAAASTEHLSLQVVKFCVVRNVQHFLERRTTTLCFSQWRLGKRGAQILAELTEIHGEEAISKAAVYRWISEFKDGQREVFADKSARGRPTCPTRKLLIEKIKSILASDRRVTVRELADRLGSPKTSIHRVFTEDLAMVKLSALWVSRLLTDEMKAARVEACRQKFRLVRDFGGWEEFKFALVTGDETWVPHFDPETKEESKV
jgi:hypothetical protein